MADNYRNVKEDLLYEISEKRKPNIVQAQGNRMCWWKAKKIM